MLNKLCFTQNILKASSKFHNQLWRSRLTVNYPFNTGPRICTSANTFFRREIDERVEAKLKGKDGIRDEFKIIYRAPLLTYVKWAYSVAFGSSIVLPFILGPIILVNEVLEFPVMMKGIPLFQDFIEVTAFCAGLILVIFNVTVVVSRYPLRIYTDKNRANYIAVYQHFLPWKNQLVSFSSGCAKKITGWMPWKDSLYSLNGRKAILMEDYFVAPVEFNKMIDL